MNIKELIDRLYEAKESGHTEKHLEEEIFKYCAQDDKIIPALLSILAQERIDKSNLLSEMGTELSMGLATLEAFTNDKEQVESTKLRIKIFYKKWEHKIQCCFKIPGLK
jgi:hypothetical protein